MSTSSQTRSLFGTDGVRGVANRDLTPELALRLGRAFGARLGAGATVAIARDTRRSGPMLEAALAAGLSSTGIDVVLAGVMPTPALAEMVPRIGAAAGAVISASHNPFPDNGIKLFGSDGFKLADAVEAAIEHAMAADDGDRPVAVGVGDIYGDDTAAEAYIASMVARYPRPLDSLSVVVDCANGATWATAPAVLTRLGTQITVIAAEPDGVNINVGCGSTHLDLVARVVREGGHDLGVAFDGDGDRMLAVDRNGTVVDGDQILAICALALRRRGVLTHDAVVTTTMTNLGFRRAMTDAGIEVRWTDVGDRYVMQEMRGGNYVLGGEQSGHLINLLHGPSGDGLAAALELLGALVETGEDLTQAASIVTRLPQRLVNIVAPRKAELPSAGEVWEAVRSCEAVLGDDGRVVVRPSGTEPLVRIMVEAPTIELCDLWCGRIAEVAERVLGAGAGPIDEPKR